MAGFSPREPLSTLKLSNTLKARQKYSLWRGISLSSYRLVSIPWDLSNSTASYEEAKSRSHGDNRRPLLGHIFHLLLLFCTCYRLLELLCIRRLRSDLRNAVFALAIYVMRLPISHFRFMKLFGRETIIRRVRRDFCQLSSTTSKWLTQNPCKAVNCVGFSFVWRADCLPPYIATFSTGLCSQNLLDSHLSSYQNPTLLWFFYQSLV